MNSVGRKLRILTFSTLYPSSNRPGHGIFVETRLRELLRGDEVDAKVIAPVPWFPFTDARFGEYGRMAATPARELHNGIDVLHPRYALPPKVGMNVAPLTLALGARKAVQQVLNEDFDFDLIDAHYFYPDGVAAALLAHWFKRPFTVTARGTDLNLIPQYALPRRLMKWTAHRANASIGVCRALVDVLKSWDVDSERLHVFRNGVDLQRFRPIPQAEARSALGLTGSPLLLSVGYLIARKGQHFLIEALAELREQLPGARLVLVGDGPERARLESLAARLGVQGQVTFAGAVNNVALYQWYSAADIFLLASSREGWANVLLESMACGTPVVATNIWGTPEVVANATVGRLVGSRDGAGFAAGIADLWRTKPDRFAVRTYAEGFSWKQTSDAQFALFSQIVAPGQRISHA